MFEAAVVLTPLRGQMGWGGRRDKYNELKPPPGISSLGVCRAQNLAGKLWAHNGDFRFTFMELEG